MKRSLLFLLLFFAVTATAREREITLTRDFGTLHGTLLTPEKGAETAVLIIAGSGPTDRNGNGQGLSTDAYRQLAEALEQSGIASLRYDKRGIAASRYDFPAKMDSVTFEDFIDDAAALADLLAAEGFRRVVLVGHSEGALIALCAAQQSKAVSGVLSLCGAGYPMSDLLQTQLGAQLAQEQMGLLMETTEIIAELKRGKRVDVEQHSPVLKMLFNPGVQTFLITTFRYDPRREIRKVGVPVLIVGGDNDVQIGPENAEELQKARPDARKIIIEGLTHPLKHSAARTLAEQAATVYRDPSLPIDTRLVAVVTEFIQTL